MCELFLRASRDGQRRYISMVIDEQTYRGMRISLGELNPRVRYRLSPQCRWNPYMQRYFAVVTTLTHNDRQVQYFPCSERFRRSLHRLGESWSAPGSGTTCGQAGGYGGPRPSAANDSTNGALRLTAAVICAFLCISLTAMVLQGEVDRLPDGVNAPPNGHVREAAAAYDGPSNISVTTNSYMSNASLVMEYPDPDDSSSDGNVSTEEMETAAEEPTEKSIQTEVGDRIYSLPEGYVALTFDDGPTPYTEQIVDTLREYEAVATFFFIGEHVVGYRDAVEYAAAKDMGLGNHSWSHANLRNLSPGELKREIIETNDLIHSIAGSEVSLFRPPYGDMDEAVAEVVGEEQMATVMWNGDPEDWQIGSPEEIVDYIIRSDSCGSIYLLHETRRTLEALPAIIEYFQRKDLTLVTFDLKGQ